MHDSKVIFEIEFVTEDINKNYYATDQTSMRETYLFRNFYDTSFIPGYAPNTDIKIADILYASVNSQQSPINFDLILQNIWITINVNYNNVLGYLNFQYVVANTEFDQQVPNRSIVNAQAGVFRNVDDLHVLTRTSPTNPDRILFTFYQNY